MWLCDTAGEDCARYAVREKHASFISQTGNPNPEQLNHCTNNTEGRPKKELNLLKGIDGEWREKMGMVGLTGKRK